MKRASRILALATTLFGAVAIPAFPADSTWTGTTGDWSDSANWSSGVPTGTGGGNPDRGVIGNGGTALITNTQAAVGILVQGGSTVIVVNASSALTVDQSANAADVGSTGGIGTMIQSNGTVTVGSTTLAESLRLAVTSAANGSSYQMLNGTLTVYGDMNVGGGGFGSSEGGEAAFIQSGGDVFVRTNGVNTGRFFLGGSRDSTYTITGGSLTVFGTASIAPGGGNTVGQTNGLGTLTIDDAGATVEFKPALSVGIKGQGLIEVKAGTMIMSGSTASLLVGNGNTGTVTQTGGEVRALGGGGTPVNLGNNSTSVGTYNLYGGTLNLTNGVFTRDIAIGFAAGSVGYFNLGNATGRGTIGQLAPGADIIVRNNATASGTFRGWSDDGASNTIQVTGTLGNSGRVIADGYGTERSLNFSGSSAVNNAIDNGVTESNGWFAVNKGKLKLPSISVTAGTSTKNWGEAAADTTIDLINSTRTTITGASAGLLSEELLASDRTDLPTGQYNATSLLNGFVGIWDYSNTFSFTSAQITYRYDDFLASSLGIAEADLKLYQFNTISNMWLDITSGAPDTVNHRLTSPSVTSFGFFGIGLLAAPIPEPTTAVLLASGLGLLMFRRKYHRRRL